MTAVGGVTDEHHLLQAYHDVAYHGYMRNHTSGATQANHIARRQTALKLIADHTDAAEDPTEEQNRMYQSGQDRAIEEVKAHRGTPEGMCRG